MVSGGFFLYLVGLKSKKFGYGKLDIAYARKRGFGLTMNFRRWGRSFDVLDLATLVGVSLLETHNSKGTWRTSHFPECISGPARVFGCTMEQPNYECCVQRSHFLPWPQNGQAFFICAPPNTKLLLDPVCGLDTANFGAGILKTSENFSQHHCKLQKCSGPQQSFVTVFKCNFR